VGAPGTQLLVCEIKCEQEDPHFIMFQGCTTGPGNRGFRFLPQLIIIELQKTYCNYATRNDITSFTDVALWRN